MRMLTGQRSYPCVNQCMEGCMLYSAHFMSNQCQSIISSNVVAHAQEFTGLGRAEAIEMLYQFGGDPNAVMAHLFP